MQTFVVKGATTICVLVFFCEYLNMFSMWVYLVTLLATHPLEI